MVTENDVIKYSGQVIDVKDLERHYTDFTGVRDYIKAFDEHMNRTSKIKIKK